MVTQLITSRTFPNIASLKLIPTIPGSNRKYENSLERVPPVKTETTIPTLTRFSSHEGLPLPRDWVEYVHPEGNIYYSNIQAGIVTNIDPRRDGVTADFNDAIEKIQSRLPTSDSKPDTFEVYLGIPDGLPLSQGTLEYYVVDYDHRSIFWIEDVDILTDLVGSPMMLDRFESRGHLRLGLEPEFWLHVEYYPCHQPIYDQKAEKELAAVFRHGCVDDMTAPGSVFPYSADECLRYLTLLERFREDDGSTESYRRSWIARLWASICRSRLINRHGLSHPRVDRLQGFDAYLSQQTGKSLALILGDALCLGMSKRTFTQLTELWNGRIVYQRHWQPFLEGQRSEWRWTVFGGLYLTMMIAFQGIYGTSFILLVASASFAGSAIVLSTLMLHAHSAERLKTASDISSYIFMTESFTDGLRPLSITFTLPKALLGYGTLVFTGNSVHHVASQLQQGPAELLYTTTAAAAIPLLIALAVYRAYGPATF
ncbi:hypothetical protein M407DRAFT_20354 [Tulasnella calospora MUT 4182]|uniref:WW domain-containing protein n=1 Tax=Tulasnella calospora MUT 4182 TaxID=1051891 RepID=A0A0C3L9P4_9AGAM|nr:hypothetical protein M407DRAFT_20354 [Tulasnella calospora MUT 4182]